MAEDFNLVIEHLRTIRGDMSAMKTDMHLMKEDLNSIKLHVSALVGAEARQDGELSMMKQRLDRIETRLNLVDQPH